MGSISNESAPLLRPARIPHFRKIEHGEHFAIGRRERSLVLTAAFAERVGYTFQKPALLLSALTHASGALHRLSSNERLEFLGDAILGAIVCELLYEQFPEYLEGDLTKIKSVVVSRSTLAKLSAESGLQDFLILGKGCPRTRKCRPVSWPMCLNL